MKKSLKQKKTKRNKSDGTDTFWDGTLCAECKQLGFCKLRRKKDVVAAAPKLFQMSDTEISNLVPSNIPNGDSNYYGKFTRKHLHVAFEAFHQQDYETAILNCKAVLEEFRYNLTAHMVLAVCYHALQDYETAMEHCAIVYNSDSRMQYFMLHCQNKLRKQKQAKQTIHHESKAIATRF